MVEECIQSQDQELLPQDEIKKLYAREFYEDVFKLLLDDIDDGKKSFAISGTPGIGKSLFYVYILYRLMGDFRTKTLSWKPYRVVYQKGSKYILHLDDERAEYNYAVKKDNFRRVTK